MSHPLMTRQDRVLRLTLNRPDKYNLLTEPLCRDLLSTLRGAGRDRAIDFGRGPATHTLFFEPATDRLTGTHRGEFFSGDLTGSVSGPNVKFRSAHRVHGTRLSYDFTGRLDGDTITGTVFMGEYGTAPFTATRHKYQQSGRRG